MSSHGEHLFSHESFISLLLREARSRREEKEREKVGENETHCTLVVKNADLLVRKSRHLTCSVQGAR